MASAIHWCVSGNGLFTDWAGIALTLGYLLVSFPQQVNFLFLDQLGRHHTPALWRSSLRKSSSPRASANIERDYPALSLRCGTRASRRATSCADRPFSRQTANES